MYYSISKFHELTTDEVSKLISELNTKSCELDALPTHLFKAYLNDLLPNVTKPVNLSLQQGIFGLRPQTQPIYSFGIGVPKWPLFL